MVPSQSSKPSDYSNSILTSNLLSTLQSLLPTQSNPGNFGEPKPFTGCKYKKLKTFLFQCQLYFWSSSKFQDDSKWVTFALSYISSGYCSRVVAASQWCLSICRSRLMMVWFIWSSIRRSRVAAWSEARRSSITEILCKGRLWTAKVWTDKLRWEVERMVSKVGGFGWAMDFTGVWEEWMGRHHIAMWVLYWGFHVVCCLLAGCNLWRWSPKCGPVVGEMWRKRVPDIHIRSGDRRCCESGFSSWHQTILCRSQKGVDGTNTGRTSRSFSFSELMSIFICC